MVINLGDVYWVQPESATGLEPRIPHPHVVIRDHGLNASHIHTVDVCALTSNHKRVNLPGNILLEAGEASLPRPSVVEASKVSTIAIGQLGEYIGSLSDEQVRQILAGNRFIQRSFLDR